MTAEDSPQSETVQNESVRQSQTETKSYSIGTIFVSKISTSVSQQEFESFFSDIGPIRHCFLIQSKKTAVDAQEGASEEKTSQASEHKGCGFVRYSMPEDAKSAVQKLNGTAWKGKTIQVELAIRRKMPDTGSSEKKEPVPLPLTTAEKNAAKKQAALERKQKDAIKRAESGFSRLISIKDLPENVDRKQIYKKVRKLGTVENIDYPLEDEPKTAKVLFATVHDAKEAFRKLDGHIFKGEKLACSYLPHIETKSTRLIVRNLSFNCKVENLQAVFEPFGRLVDVSIPGAKTGDDSAEGQETSSKPHKGFGFVQYSTVDDAQIAMAAVNGQTILNRIVAVDFALPKRQYEQMKVEEEENQENGEDVVQEENGNENNVMNVDSDREDSESVDIAFEGMDVDSQPQVAETPQKRDVLEDGCTLFVRNLLFETTEESLSELFSKFGKLRYAKITMDKATGRSRGTGFVSFWKSENAQECLSAYKAAESLALSTSTSAVDKAKPGAEAKKKSIIIPELPKSTEETMPTFILDGRFLNVNLAVSRENASRLAHEGDLSRRKTDKRNLYLLKEGHIHPESEAATSLPKADLEKRQGSYDQRKRLLASNPSLFVSRTRLSLRNIPKTLNETMIKKFAVRGIRRFWKEVEEGERATLEKEVFEDEAAEGLRKPGAGRKIHIVQAKIMREKDRIDPVTKKPKSKGYAFLEFQSHADALTCLRALNNNPNAFHEEDGDSKSSDKETTKRPIVEFAIENSVTLKRRNDRNQKPSGRSKTDEKTEVHPEQQSYKSKTGDKYKKTQGKQNKRKRGDDDEDVPEQSKKTMKPKKARTDSKQDREVTSSSTKDKKNFKSKGKVSKKASQEKDRSSSKKGANFLSMVQDYAKAFKASAAE